ncbi:MAG: DUF541 domain-containing protein [Alphaproteobacteria bacterium]|nr:DUF541 domain-containing protein [Alphaproteobacteria bacterium]
MRRILILPLLLVLAAPLAADEPPRLTVTGEGRVEVAPDMARITLGILAREATAEGALAAAAGRARGARPPRGGRGRGRGCADRIDPPRFGDGLCRGGRAAA